MYVVRCFGKPVKQILPDSEEGLRIITCHVTDSDFLKFDSKRSADSFAIFIKEFCGEIPVSMIEVK